MQKLKIGLTSSTDGNRMRIRRILDACEFKASDMQIEILLERLEPIPANYRELRALVLANINLFPGFTDDQYEDLLRHVADCYESEHAGDDQYVHEFFAEWAAAITRGVNCHPDWWTLPCECITCMENKIKMPAVNVGFEQTADTFP